MSRPARTKSEPADRQTQTPVSADGIASRHLPDLENCPASSVSRLGLCKQKMEHILRYLENHFSMPQETPGTPLLPSDASSGNAAAGAEAEAPAQGQTDGPASAQDEAPAAETISRRHKGKRPLRRSTLRSNAGSASNVAPLPLPSLEPREEASEQQTFVGTSHMHGPRGSATHLGTIQFLPKAPLSSRRPKSLGIFNKGKAVVSSPGTGIAFSEAEFLKAANIERLLVNYAQHENATTDNGADGAATYFAAHRAPADDAASSGKCISRRSTTNSNGSSHAVRKSEAAASAHNGHLEQQQQEQPCEYVVRTSPVSRCGSRSRSIQSNSNSNSSSSRNRSISQGSVETFQQPAASLFVEDIPNRHRDLSHAHESWQQGTGAADAPEMPLSSTTQQSVFLQPDGGQMHGSNRTAQNALGAGPLLHTSFVRSLLANSIAERMDEEDVEFQPTPVHSTGNSNSSSSSSNISRGSIGAGGDNAMDLDVSMLFDRHAGGGLACDTSYSRFNMRNDYPLEGLSGINSSFFASQDMPYQRCLGETTISDFGMSRYGNPFNPSIYQSYPIGLENRRSCDTLPEYAPTSALPPAYSLLSLSPHQHAGIQTCADMHNSNMSLAGGSGMPLNRSYSARGESARNSNPVLNVSYMSDSRSGLMDLVYFPRKMN